MKTFSGAQLREAGYVRIRPVLQSEVQRTRSQTLQKTTSELIDLTLDLDGTYYLPYQLFCSRDQLRRAYPRIDEFFAAKKAYDPEEIFTNKFYEKYGRMARP